MGPPSTYNLILTQTIISFCNFALLLIVLILGATYGFRVQNQVKVYWDAANVSPPMVGHIVNQTSGIIDNVYHLSANMVPISEKTVQILSNETGATNNVTFVEAATKAMLGVGQADWKAVIGNASLALGSVAVVNYTAITDLIKQVQDPNIQSVVKDQVQHALNSFDFATAGAASMYTTFTEGLFKQSKINEQKS
jgi:hypothetical protein